MPKSRRFIRFLAIGLLTIEFCPSGSFANELLQVIQRAERSNEAWLQLLSAQSALAQETSRRIEALESDGHASWAQTSKQRASAQAVLEHRQAAQEFRVWLGELRNTLALSPGPELGTSTDPENLAAAVDEAERMRWLQREVDAARTRFTELLEQDEPAVKDAEKNTAGSFPQAYDFPPGPVEILALAAHPQLASATRQVAKIAADKRADSRIADILLRKSHLHLQAVKALHAQGFTPDADLQAARQAVADQQHTLAKAAATDRRHRDDWALVHRQFAACDSVSAQQSPSAAIQVRATQIDEPAHLRALIAMRLAQFQAEARRREAQIEARRLAELLRRLEQTGLDHQSARRERALTRLDLELAEARTDAELESIVACRYQTQRFVATLNHNRPSSRLVGLIATAAGVVTPQVAIGCLARPCGSPFSNGWSSINSAYATLPRCLGWRRINYVPRNRSRLGYRSLWTLPCLSYTRRICDLGSYLDGVHYRRLLSRVGVRPAFRPWGFPRYYDIYTFGRQYPHIWRSSWRSHCLPRSGLWPFPSRLWTWP